ncbi:NADH-quinone oxidoreductase subunit C [Roseibium sp. SCP14]|uniref:NADH-quinone oxidoreductase subunit C n=1 Tax=Roseibium sp. SCP14 TaxID=3141375 RepID=UPI003A969005
MTDRRPAFCDRIMDHFGDRVSDGGAGIDMHNIEVAPENLKELCRFLLQAPELSFDFLSDLCGVDFLPDNPRFAVVYHLYSTTHQHRLRLKCRFDDPPRLPTVADIWTTANWHEREAFDMYGIVFEGHPNLKRIYMWDEFDGYPMRKDFPVRGYKDEYNPFGKERGEQ